MFISLVEESLGGWHKVAERYKEACCCKGSKKLCLSLSAPKNTKLVELVL